MRKQYEIERTDEVTKKVRMVTVFANSETEALEYLPNGTTGKILGETGYTSALVTDKKEGKDA
jgi:hypothetical protein